MVISAFISFSETENKIFLICSVSNDNGDEDVRILTDSEDDSLIVVHEEEEEEGRKEEVNIAGELELRNSANQDNTTSKAEPCLTFNVTF